MLHRVGRAFAAIAPMGFMRVFNNPRVPTNRLIVEFYLRNFGKTPAIIESYQADLIHPDSDDVKFPNSDIPQIVRKPILGGGDHTDRLKAEIRDFSGEEWASVVAGQTHLYFKGHFIYAEIWGSKWVFSFDWEYGPTQGRLMPDHRARKKIELGRTGPSQPTGLT
jgi:hypothetical protein